ncbi:hypothetical protein IFR05_010697 [Cadophora sp. M221]|nr:hypothetical protein IFR05_010697 [Cadophora sp. M221]
MPSIEDTHKMAQSDTWMSDTGLETVVSRVENKLDHVALDDTWKEIEENTIPLTPKAGSSIGFAIDLDGVLFHKGDNKVGYDEPLPGALATLKRLENLKVPFVLLTNRIYRSGKRGSAQLKKALKLQSLSPYQLIHRLTPFKYLVPLFGHKHVLVIGSNLHNYRKLAKSLGFKDVYLPEDFYEVYPELASKAFSTSRRQDLASRAQTLRENLHAKGPDVEISAILVFCSDGPVGADEDLSSPNKLLVQILKSESGDLRIKETRQKIYYETCYTEYEDFRKSLERDWEAETRRPALLHQFEVGGKPAAPMYSYADEMLREHQQELHGDDVEDFERVVIIGDTPECDMRGTNRHKMTRGQGDKWKSVLVASGSHDFGADGMPEGEDRPDAVADDFSEAVISSLRTFGVDFGPLEDSEDDDKSEWSYGYGSEDEEENGNQRP